MPMGDGLRSGPRCGMTAASSFLGVFRIAGQVADHRRHVHIVMVRVPTIKVRDHGDRRIRDFSFPRQFRFRHIGHADHVTAPLAVEVALGFRRELRALHDQIGAATMDRHVYVT